MKFTETQRTILSAIILGEMETVSNLIDNMDPHWNEYYKKLSELSAIVDNNQRTELLWGFLELEDGTEISLEGTNVLDLTLTSPIKDYGRDELGEEAGILVECNYKRDKDLNSIKKVRRYFKKYMQ